MALPDKTSIERCPAKKIESNNGRRSSWQCELIRGHKGRHHSASGHRTWSEPEVEFDILEVDDPCNVKIERSGRGLIVSVDAQVVLVIKHVNQLTTPFA